MVSKTVINMHLGSEFHWTLCICGDHSSCKHSVLKIDIINAILDHPLLVVASIERLTSWCKKTY